MRSDGVNSSLVEMFLYWTSALLSMGPRSGAATMGNPSVFKKLPSTAADSLLVNRSLAKKSNLGLFLLPNCGLSSMVRRVGRLVMMLMTPPIAMLPYRLDDVPSVISTRSTLASGTLVQYTHPPNGSLKGMPSSRTRVRLCPLGPIPRSETPWVVGCATRLLVRRKRLNVGTC